MIKLSPNKRYIKRDIWGREPLDESTPYIEDGRIFRDLDQHVVLRGAVKRGTTQKLAAQNLVVNHELDESKGRIEVEKIPWCVSSRLYCKRQSRDGLLNLLRLTEELNKRNLTLRDFNSGQLGMKYSEVPLLVDLGSIYQPISTYRNMLFKEAKEWAMSLGLDTRATNIRQLIVEVEGFYPKEASNVWDTYDGSSGDKLASESDPEIHYINHWLDKYGAKSVFDAGANRGRMSKFIAEKKRIPVLACDTAGRCIEDLYLWAQRNESKITALKWDFMEPPCEFSKKYGPTKCDYFIASSVTHHLQRAGHDFVKQEKVIRQNTRRIALVEYIDPSDSAIRSWRAKWTKQQFEDAFSEWTLLDTHKPNRESRIWYAYAVCGV